MFGKGLLTGMGITLRRFFGKKTTVQYPEEKIPMTPRFRGGVIELDAGKCIACGLCAMACPNNVLEVKSAVDENKKRRLTAYLHCAGLCLYCNLCLEACPVQAIRWDQNYELSRFHREDLVFDCLARAKRAESVRTEDFVQKVNCAEGRAVGG